MRELSNTEIDVVCGAVDQSTAISTNLGIVAIGVGVIAGGLTAPAWFPLGLIAVSIFTIATMER